MSSTRSATRRTFAAGANGIALGVLAAYVAIREPERRADPEDSYDPIAVGRRGWPSFWRCRSSSTSPTRGPGSPAALVGGLCGLSATRSAERRGVSKYTALDDDLHAYMVAQGARQDEVLARVQAETAAHGLARGDADRARPGRVHGDPHPRHRRAGGARDRHLHRLLGDLDRPRPGARRAVFSASSSPRSTRRRRPATSRRRASPIGSRSSPARRPRRFALLPEREHFDLVFIDADKTGYDVYFEEALKRTRQGGLILLDNMLQDGRVLDPDPDDESTNAIVALNEKLAADERIDLAMVAIADGITIARKR